MRFGVHPKLYLFSLVLLLMSAGLFSIALQRWISEQALSLYLLFLFPCVWSVTFLVRCSSCGVWVDDHVFRHKHYENGFTNEIKPSEVLYMREGKDKNAYVFIELLDEKSTVLDRISERYIYRFEVLYHWAKENFKELSEPQSAERSLQEKNS